MSGSRDVEGEILEAATEMFAARGFDGTTLQSIADAVDITKPSLLYHYSSKEELRDRVLAAVFEHWNSVLPQILDAATSGDRRFEALIQEVIRFFSDDPDRARLLLREVMDRPEEMREILSENLAPWISILSDYIENGRDEGLIYEELEPDVYLVNVIHLIVGGFAASSVFGTLLEEVDGASREGRRVEETVRMARSALFVDEASGPDREERPSRVGEEVDDG